MINDEEYEEQKHRPIEQYRDGDLIRHQGQWLEILYRKANSLFEFRIMCMDADGEGEEREFIAAVGQLHLGRKLKPKKVRVHKSADITSAKEWKKGA